MNKRKQSKQSKQIEPSMQSKQSKLEKKFVSMWGTMFPNIVWVEEYKFLSDRKFRFDFADVDKKIAIEINGGSWIPSGHSTGTGLNSDYEKLNLATLEGWTVFQLSSEMINTHWLALINQYYSSKT